MAFKKATKEQARLRLALFGPSGAGKTMTALRIANGIGGTIAVIDTERGSASKYADRFGFDVNDLAQKSIVAYLAAIKEAAAEKYNVLVIDSLSHAWQELLTEVDRLAKSKFKGNTWSAWSEGTPKQKQLIEAILDYPGHVIVTMRSKTEWVQEQSDNGKTKPVRVGLAPEQGKGIEYEFDLLMELSTEHVGMVLKDRTGKYQDETIDKPGEEFGKNLAAWLADGAPAAKRAPEAADDAKYKEYATVLWSHLGELSADGKLTRENADAIRPFMRAAYQLGLPVEKASAFAIGATALEQDAKTKATIATTDWQAAIQTMSNAD